MQELSRYAFCTSQSPLLPALAWQIPPDDGQLEALLKGSLTVFGYPWQWSQDGSCWHRSPDTGDAWPRRFFADIPIQASNPSGDIRMTWEPSRLQHLVLLALLAQQAESALRERAAAVCEAQLLSWVDANPFLTGIHYISPTECALRLLAVCYAMDLIRPWLPAPERAWPAVLTLISGHAELIRKRLSLRLATPHDTLAAATALIYAGSLFPEMQQAERWLAFGHYLLEENTPRHISHDGGSQEQGLGYLQFSTDLYGLVLALLDHRQQPVPEKIRQVFDRSREFLGGVPQQREWEAPADRRWRTRNGPVSLSAFFNTRQAALTGADDVSSLRLFDCSRAGFRAGDFRPWGVGHGPRLCAWPCRCVVCLASGGIAGRAD